MLVAMQGHMPLSYGEPLESTGSMSVSCLLFFKYSMGFVNINCSEQSYIISVANEAKMAVGRYQSVPECKKDRWLCWAQ